MESNIYLNHIIRLCLPSPSEQKYIQNMCLCIAALITAFGLRWSVHALTFTKALVMVHRERISWATSLKANQRRGTRHFEGRSELRLDWAEYDLACPPTVKHSLGEQVRARTRRCICVKNESGTLMATGRVRRSTAAQPGPPHIKESKQVPREALLDGQARAALRTTLHWDGLHLRCRCETLCGRRSYSPSLIRPLLFCLPGHVVCVQHVAWEDAGTGHWFTPSII